MTTLGTIQTKYSKKWIYFNPDPFDGPNSWNVANLPIDENTAEIFAIPPIVVAEDSGNVTLSYSIIDCKGLDEVDKLLLIGDVHRFFRSTLPDINSIVGELPIDTNKFESDTCLL